MGVVAYTVGEADVIYSAAGFEALGLLEAKSDWEGKT
jgi:hypothetical protein